MSNIPDAPILRFLAGPYDGWPVAGLATWFWSSTYRPANSVVRAMPEGTREADALKKIEELIDRGLVAGCVCGCRGDFELTDAGREALHQLPADG